MAFPPSLNSGWPTKSFIMWYLPFLLCLLPRSMVLSHWITFSYQTKSWSYIFSPNFQDIFKTEWVTINNYKRITGINQGYSWQTKNLKIDYILTYLCAWVTCNGIYTEISSPFFFAYQTPTHNSSSNSNITSSVKPLDICPKCNAQQISL